MLPAVISTTYNTNVNTACIVAMVIRMQWALGTFLKDSKHPELSIYLGSLAIAKSMKVV